MAQQTVLEVAPRDVMGKATRHLRRKGLIPANVYGHKEASQALQIDAVAFDRLLRAHAASSLIALQLPKSANQTVLIRHVQRNPVTMKILHVDFSRVNLLERIDAKIPLHFVGVAPAVKILGGVLLHVVETLALECAAEDIVEYLDVDISTLTEIDSALYVRDVKLPDNYKLLADPDEAVVKVAASRTEAPEVAAEGVITGGVPETAANPGA